MGEIKRSDLIEDDALMAPLVLSKNFETLLGTIVKLKGEVGKNSGLAESATTITGVGTAIEQLVVNEKELVKVNNQLATAIAKDTESYAALKKKVDETNQSAKTRIQLGDREAISINKTNASLTQLQAALTRNRQAYAALSNEQARNSSEGKKLLGAIQLQDKQFKELSGTLGQHQAHVGDYAGQLGKANTAAQALSPSLHGMATAIWAGVKAAAAFVLTPLGLTLAAIALLLSPIVAYFTSTAEGQDRVNVATAEYNARLQVLIDRLTNAGREMAKSREEMTDFDKEVEKGPRNFIQNWGDLILSFFPKLSKEMDDAGKAAAELAETLDSVGEAEAKFGVEAAELENQQKRLILQSKNRTLSEEERIAFIDKALKLEEQVKDKRIQFADQELEAIVKAAATRLQVEQNIDQSLVGEGRMQAYRKFAKELIDTARTKDDTLAESLIESLKKQSDAEAFSITVEEKLQNQRDALLDKQLESDKKRAEEKKKLQEEDLDFYREAYALRVQAQQLQYQKEKEIRDKEKADEKAKMDALKKMLDTRAANEKAASDKRLRDQEKEREANKAHLEKILSDYQQWSDAILNLTFSITAGRIQSIDAQLERLEEATERELELAGENEDAKKQIEDKADVRRKQLEDRRKVEMRKQAVLEKTAALIEAAIRTSLAVLLQLGTPPGTTAFQRSFAAGALGAVQIAAIAARPIPQFFKGTDNSPEGLAFVGERGAELKVEPSGKMSLTPNVPTLDYLKAGTQIIPHDETMRMLALSGLGKDVLMQREQAQQIELAKSLKQIEKNTRKMGKSTSGGNLYKQGILTYEQKVKEDGSKQNIRRSILGR